jgi:hypothetical protein
MMRLLVVLALIGLSGCSKQEAVRTGLVDAGVSGPVADCMSAEMAKRLSVAQLRKLSRAAARPGEASSGLTVSQYIDRANRVGDPQVVAVTAAAAAYCAAIR